jgi:L-ascorbate metabolism protein UlaG (beta-lactamase superfamily)
MKRVLLILLAVLTAGILLLLLDAWVPMGKSPWGERLAWISMSPQWKGEAFANPLPEKMDVWKALTRSFWGDGNRHPSVPIPVDEPRFDQPPKSGLRITWFGHSSLLVEMDGVNVLIDPVWGERCSPTDLMGPKRFHPNPIELSRLPKVDAVVISHDHYDHLDEPTFRVIKGWDSKVLVPLGVASHLEYWGFGKDRVIEMDWWDEARVGKLKLACLPARHFSGRSVGDRNKTLWSGWALLGPKHKVYYSGDTAMFPGIKDIGKKYGPFDASLIEVGAYNQSWADVHLGPEQAVEAHKIVRGGVFVPVHWGTFNLAPHGWTEPIERIVVAAQKAKVPLVTPRPGESVEPTGRSKVHRWWPELPWKTAEESPNVSSGLERKP